MVAERLAMSRSVTNTGWIASFTGRAEWLLFLLAQELLTLALIARSIREFSFGIRITNKRGQLQLVKGAFSLICMRVLKTRLKGQPAAGIYKVV